MDLDNEIRSTRWDVILVDAPRGFDDECPGRMKSIYEASRLIKSGGHVFVHDCERVVEREYTDKYFLEGNLVEEVEEIGNLRHYIIK